MLSSINNILDSKLDRDTKGIILDYIGADYLYVINNIDPYISYIFLSEKHYRTIDNAINNGCPPNKLIELFKKNNIKKTIEIKYYNVKRDTFITIRKTYYKKRIHIYIIDCIIINKIDSNLKSIINNNRLYYYYN